MLIKFVDGSEVCISEIDIILVFAFTYFNKNNRMK